MHCPQLDHIVSALREINHTLYLLSWVLVFLTVAVAATRTYRDTK